MYFYVFFLSQGMASFGNISSIKITSSRPASDKDTTLFLSNVQAMPRVMEWKVTNMDISVSNSNLPNLKLTVEQELHFKENAYWKQNVSLINSTIGNLIGKNINLHVKNCHFTHRIQQFPIFVLTGSDATFSKCHVHNVTIKTSHLSPSFNFTKPIMLPKYDPMSSNLTVIKAWNSHLIVTNSIFSNNIGSAFDVRDRSHLEIVNSTISGNKGQYGCSVFASNRSALILIKSSFTNNWYQNATVTVQRNSRIMVKECEFSNNISPIRSDAAIGSVLVIRYNTSFKIIASTFFANVASKGGAIFLGQVGSGQIENCTFHRNLAIQGGAINANSRIEVNISGCTFDNNTALEILGEDRSRNNKELNGQAVAGAIMFFDSCHGMIENSEFIKNKALYAGSLLIEKNSSVEINNCTFKQSWAFEGGAIYIHENSFLYINSTMFIENAATAKVLYDPSQITNILEYSDIKGGAIAAALGVRVVLYKCQFLRNVATTGGAIQITNGTLLIYTSIFKVNNATQGGAVDAMHVRISVNRTEFESNFAFGDVENVGNSGGIRVSNSEVFSISHSSFIGHTSPQGAVLTIINTTFYIEFSVFWFNHGQRGAIINSIENANGILTHSTFTNNTSPTGGLLLFSGTKRTRSLIEMYNCDFIYNTPGPYGSPINIQTNVNMVISYSHFIGNSDLDFGGVFYCLDCSLHIYHSEFKNNIANRGSVIFSKMNTGQNMYSVLIENSTFIDNIALYQSTINAEETNIIISESTFFRNLAGYGGVLASTSGDVIISNSYFYENKASSTGGVLYLQPSKTNILTISNSTFESNEAGRYGAVLYTEDSLDIAIDLSIFIENKATSDYAICLQNCWSLRTSYSSFNGIDDEKKKSYIYFSNNKRIDTVYRTFKTSFAVNKGNMSGNKWATDDDSQMITQYETPFASGMKKARDT